MLTLQSCCDCELCSGESRKLICGVCKMHYCRFCHDWCHELRRFKELSSSRNIHEWICIFLSGVFQKESSRAYHLLCPMLNENGDKSLCIFKEIKGPLKVGSKVGIGGITRFGSLGKVLSLNNVSKRWSIKLFGSGEMVYYLPKYLVQYEMITLSFESNIAFSIGWAVLSYNGKKCFVCHIKNRRDKNGKWLLKYCPKCPRTANHRPRYCSRKCQKYDWKEHKLHVCSALYLSKIKKI